MSGSSASGASTISVRRPRRWARILWISPTVSPGSCKHHFGEQAACIAGELLPQPDFDDLDEGEVGLVAVHHDRAGIDVRLDRIGLDQALTEAVDGRAGDFVDRRAGGREMAAVAVGQAIGQGDPKLGGNATCRQLANEVADTDEKLAGRELGERHRGDGLGRNAFGQHQSDAAGHDGGLAGTGAGLDQKRAVVNADRSAPRDVIGERFQRRVHH